MWDSMIEMMEFVMQHIVEIAILCFEFIGVIVIIISGAKGFLRAQRAGNENYAGTGAGGRAGI